MKAPDSYYSPQDLEKAVAAIDDILRVGQGKVELPLISKDGKSIPTEYFASTIKDDQGTPRYIISVGRDITERKQAEAAVMESEERFKRLFDNSADGILLADIETKKIFTGNKTLCEMIGYSYEEIEKMSIKDIHPEEDLPHVIDEFEKKARKESIFARDIPVKRKDGTVFYVDINSFHISIGGQTYLAGSFRDITNRRKAEEVLKESEERLRLISEASFEGIAITEKGKVVDVNQQIADIFGYSVSEMIGKKVIDFVAPESRDIVHEKIKESYGDQYEHLALKKDGSRINVEVRGRNITYKGRSVRLTSIRDITERKLAEEALMESEERFRELAELLPESIFEINTDITITYANRNAFEQFGYTDKDFEKGINGIGLLVPEDRERAVENMRRILSGEDIGINEYTAERKNGTRFPAMFRSAAVIRHGKPVGLRGFIIDMTEQKRLEGQLRQTQKMEAIGTLAGGIAHDFNNILTAIIGYSEVLKRKLPEDTTAVSALDNILDAGDRATDLVRQILTFSRRDEMEYAPTLIEPIAKEVLKLIRSTIPATIELRQSINSVGPVIADPTQIHQIMMNLCTNSYHTMQDSGGTMNVDLEEVTLDADLSTKYPDLNPGTYARLTITDTGQGIDPLIIDKIFDPYFTTKEKGKGTGLGLSVVHGIVKNFGGTIKVDSELSKGTAVQVLLPLVREDTAEEERSDAELPHGKETVLFVDDEESLTILCRELLEVLGYSVTAKTKGIDALELFREDPDNFDLVITDMTMPGMTGLKLSEELLKIRPDIPIILCTGYSEGLTEEYVKQKGIKAFLMKPFSSGNLSRIVRTVLDGNQH
jgi:PAS domain S-box-containing protein